MLNLLIAIDMEVKFNKWARADRAVDRLNVLAPADMRRLFVYIYKAFPTSLLFAYEAQRELVEG